MCVNFRVHVLCEDHDKGPAAGAMEGAALYLRMQAATCWPTLNVLGRGWGA